MVNAVVDADAAREGTPASSVGTAAFASITAKMVDRTITRRKLLISKNIDDQSMVILVTPAR